MDILFFFVFSSKWVFSHMYSILFLYFSFQHILAIFVSLLIRIWDRCICDLVAVMLAVKLRRENRSFSAATKWSRLLVTSIVGQKKPQTAKRYEVRRCGGREGPRGLRPAPGGH